MLPQIVLIQQSLLHGAKGGVKRHGVIVHKGNLFHHNSVMHRIEGIRAPRKGAMAVNEDSGKIRSTFTCKCLNNNLAGFFFISTS